ncbi:MutT/nudix family protein [mine drainage metagenome]|uniref:MutT/nudix family protein n=1 Tax=mine drainage metagenome TaxID=410659 RepID=T0YE38_9ZZZZ
MSFCSQCGARLTVRVPPGDHLPRYVCEACGAVHYQNPRLVVGCVPEHAGRILICRRAIEPRRGYWTVPAGFLENGETLQEGAARESREEAQVEVEIGSLLSSCTCSMPIRSMLFFRADMRADEHGAGPESLETALVPVQDIPWADLAFPSTEFSLRRYLEDRAEQRETHHFATLQRRLT